MNRLFAPILAVAALGSVLLVVASPAQAAVMPGPDILAAPDVLAFERSAVPALDCEFQAGVTVTMAFAPASENCHPMLSEASGTCLAPVASSARMGKPFTLPGTFMACRPFARPAPPG
jgi:hypothetical protein